MTLYNVSKEIQTAYIRLNFCILLNSFHLWCISYSSRFGLWNMPKIENKGFIHGALHIVSYIVLHACQRQMNKKTKINHEPATLSAE